MSVQGRVHEIVSRLTRLEPEEITPKTRVLDYIDSPDSIEFLMELEEEFDVTIPYDHAHRLETVGDAIVFLERHVHK